MAPRGQRQAETVAGIVGEPKLCIPRLPQGTAWGCLASPRPPRWGLRAQSFH